MTADLRDLGYAIYSRLEEGLRLWLRDRLLTLWGERWSEQIPKGIYGRLIEDTGFISEDHDPCFLFDKSEFSDLKQIVTFNSGFKKIVSGIEMSQGKFEALLDKGYEIRCMIAHVDRFFSPFDLATLVDLSRELVPMLDLHGLELSRILELVTNNPECVTVTIPREFLQQQAPHPSCPNNLPSGDYRSDGGFIGRTEDSKKIQQMLLSNLDRVITISGAGGVGKTALAHYTCNQLLEREKRYDAVVWISAKEQLLTVSGIEEIEPTLHNYEDVLDAVLQTMGWTAELGCNLSEKEEWVNFILTTTERGILIVVDNLETVHDEQVIEFVKNVPHPNKVLITSRLGLGEVERRHSLKELLPQDATALFRTVAREKGAESLARLPNEVLLAYAKKMSYYPLAIKWVVGQVALGKEINTALIDLTSPDGDVAAFCFEHIFEHLLDERSKIVLYALAAYERPVSPGVLSHLTNLSTSELEVSMRQLILASLVIANHSKRDDGTIETRYELLPLTLNYLQSRLQREPEVRRGISSRLQTVQNLVDEGTHATQQYRYNLKDLGAVTEEEKIAAASALNAYTRYQSGDYDSAVRLYQRAIQIAPQFAAIYRNWARMESDAGYYEKADGLLRKAVQLSPNDPTIWFVWANVELRRASFDTAHTYFTKALELGPKEAPILSAFGELEKRRKNYDQAQRLFEEALAHADQTQNQHQKLLCCINIADNLRRWADALFKKKDNDEAFKRLWQADARATEALKLASDDEHAQQVYRVTNLELGVSLFKVKGDFKKSERHLRRALMDMPRHYADRKNNAMAHYYLACGYLESKNLKDAKKHYGLGLKIEPNPISEEYEALGTEISGERIKSKLLQVHADRGFGFLECPDDDTQLIFVHISDIVPKPTPSEFESMKGTTLSYVVGFDKNSGKRKAKNVRLTVTTKL